MKEEAQRILVVDDEQGMREGCRKVLTMEGFEVETAPDGIAGLELFKKRGDFAAAIIDIKMPKMDGIELIRKIREIDNDVVLLVITAYSTIDTAVEATKRGAHDYIPKPFTPDELLLPVKNGLEKRALEIQARKMKEERERRLLEVAHERSKCKTIIGCMTDGIIVINREKQIVLQNDAAQSILAEYNSLELPFPLDSLKHFTLRDSILEVLNSDYGPNILSRELTIGKFTYMANISPIYESETSISGVVAVLHDITELKNIETAKSTFVSMVAHEIKGPLAAIESYLNLIMNGFMKGEYNKMDNIIRRSLLRIQTLRNMVTELMNITAMETGKFTLRRIPLHPGELVGEIVEDFKEKASEKSLFLNFEEFDKNREVKILADREAFKIIFSNLIDNAIKYTPAGGHILVSVKYCERLVKISVKDTGIGMNPHEKKMVFEEFYRAKNKYTNNIPGTGLGLSVVKRLLEMHNGRVEIDTAPNKGSTFIVSIPVYI